MTASVPLLLIVDDDPQVVQMLRRFGADAGYRVESRGDGRNTVPHLREIGADVALIDLHMPEVGGLEVLKAMRASAPQCRPILMTGEGSIESAIEAVKLGALDYLTKPLPLTRVRQLLDGVRDEIGGREALLLAEHDTATRLTFCGMVGRAPVMQELFALLRRLAPHVRITLVTGETGTGKELVARALHQLGPRRNKRFITINCSAVVESLFESELFGHVRGAFTGATENKIGMFEAADGGTLFLDEVGELPASAQAKLLRALELGEIQRVGALDTRKVDVHVVAATNRDLRAEVAAARFRQDLLYRLNVVEVGIPPLRERREDITYLTAAFIEACRKRMGVGITALTPGAERALLDHSWPGNVRELRNVVERACMLADGQLLTERDVAGALPAASITPPLTLHAQKGATKRLDAGDIQRALADNGGNKAAAARVLGLSRRALYRRLETTQPPHSAQ